MRSIACAIALLLLHSAIVAQNDAAPQTARDTEQEFGPYCPWTHALGDGPQEEHWFEGAIQNSKVRMYLNRGGAGVVGLFYATDGDWTPTFLGGEWSANGIKLSAEASDHDPKGHLQGQLVNGAFIGTWNPENSDHAGPVRLAPIQQPACDGRGAWKRFDDPKWPVSFSYPASWRIKEDGKTLRLICPDPETMTNNNSSVTIFDGERKKGKPLGPVQLVQCANGWRFGPECDSYDEDAVTASVKTVSEQPGKTILSLGHEWRVYCADGGYVGQGDGEDQVVVLPNYWIEFRGAGSASAIVDRMVKSARVHVANPTE
jgi:hypothetical protein